MNSYAHYLVRQLEKTRIALGVIGLIVGIAYFNVFPNTFVWDDKDTIVNWEATRHITSIPAMLMGATPPGHPGNYRPVRNILYIVSYQLWGVQPWGYHLQTVLLAIGISFLVYAITRLLAPHAPLVAFMTALLFGTHPVHVEALTWMTSMMDMYGMFFGFLAFYFFLRWRQLEKRRYYIAAFGMTVLAMFSNEITFALPLLMGLYMWVYPKKQQRLLLTVLPFFSIIIANFAIRWSLLQIGSRFTYVDNNIVTTLLVMLVASLTYWKLLVFPWGLTINHHLGNGLTSWAIELIDPASRGYQAVAALSFRSPNVILALCILLMLLIAALLLRKKFPAITFAIGWFFIAMIPVSNLLPTEAILTERFLFLASYGYCFLLAWLLNHRVSLARVDTARSKIIWILFGMLLTVYVVQTVQRNAEWSTDRSLWTTATVRNPHAFIAQVSLANMLYAHGEIEAALDAYLDAYAINPTSDDISLYIAAMYHALGKSNESIVYLTRVIRKNPWNIEAYFRLGNVYRDQQEYERAIGVFTDALKLVPHHVQILNNLGVIYGITKQYELAITTLTQALSYDPGYHTAQQNLDRIAQEMETTE